MWIKKTWALTLEDAEKIAASRRKQGRNRRTWRVFLNGDGSGFNVCVWEEKK